MITYEPLWNTLKKRHETTYTLIHKHKISSSTINRFRQNQAVTTTTLNDLCRILNCGVEDIMVYVDEQLK